MTEFDRLVAPRGDEPDPDPGPGAALMVVGRTLVIGGLAVAGLALLGILIIEWTGALSLMAAILALVYG